MKKYVDTKMLFSSFLGATLAAVIGVPGYLFLKSNFVK